MGPGPMGDNLNAGSTLPSYSPPAVLEVKEVAVVKPVEVGPKTIRMSLSCIKVPGHVFGGVKSKICVVAQKGNNAPKDLGTTEERDKDHNPVFTTTIDVLREPDTKLFFYLLNHDKREAKVEYLLADMLSAGNPWKYSFSDMSKGYRLAEAMLVVKWEEIVK